MATRWASPLLASRFTPKSLLWALPLFLAMVMSPAVWGQASYYTASHPLRLQAFGTFSYDRPDYQDSSNGPGTNYGVSLGSDIDVAAHIWVIPGLELRATRAVGPVSTQNTFGGGPRVVFPLGRVQPYADFMLSGGSINFHQRTDPSYQSDTSTVYSYGGGADLLLTPGWAFKVDVQTQRWRLSHNVEPFMPLLMSVGVRYEVHGGKHSPQ
jgi:hypothetical protein